MFFQEFYEVFVGALHFLWIQKAVLIGVFRRFPIVF